MKQRIISGALALTSAITLTVPALADSIEDKLRVKDKADKW